MKLLLAISLSMCAYTLLITRWDVIRVVLALP